MKVSLNWAQDNSNVDISSIGVDGVVAKIGAQLGAVEEVINWGAKYEGVVVAKVISCIKHPNADKLSLCKIDDGGSVKDVERDTDGNVQVVCGASNVRAGLTVAWLPPGSTVPSTANDKEPFVLGARELRDVVSNGMIASASELGISDDHNGILEIAEDVKPGMPFVDLYGQKDYIIDCENKMFTHRPDCFGILGVARELAGIQNKAFISPDWYHEEPTLPKVTDLPLTINVDTNLVPRFCAIAVKDVQVKPSLVKMQSELTKVGIRPINNIVDITNWLMHLTGQPLHAYDYDKLTAKSSNGQANLTARLSEKGDKLQLLNGKELEFKDDSTVLICAGNTPVGVGGVMGGADAEVDASTKNIVIECANFDMYNIRRTAMKYGLFTDAVTRFNKGQSPLQNAVVIARALQMVAELANGKQASELIDIKDDTVKPLPEVKVTAQFINTRLGSNLTAQEIANYLSNVELASTNDNDEITVNVPFWRRDIELPEDIVEEVGRLYGFSNLPINLPIKNAKPVAKNVAFEFRAKIRDILAKNGANEVLSYSFVHGNLIDSAGQDVNNAFKLSNAIRPDLQYYRLSLLPSLLEKVHPNIKAGYNEFSLFEQSKVHSKLYFDDNNLPVEFEHLALVFAADDKTAKLYQGEPYYQARAYLHSLSDSLNIEVNYTPLNSASEPTQDSNTAKVFLPNRSAAVHTKNGEFVGIIGEFNAKVTNKLKLPAYTAGFELQVSQLLKASQAVLNTYQQIPRYPKVSQDISLKVGNDILFKDISVCIQQALARNTPDNCLASLKPIDIYTKDNDIHYTFRLQIASYDRTLTAKEVNDLLDNIAQVANVQLRAVRI